MRQGSRLTDYHAKYYTHVLRRRNPSNSLEKLGSSLLNATVDLNPHQIDAGLLAFRSPLSRGAILAIDIVMIDLLRVGGITQWMKVAGMAEAFNLPW